MERMARIDIVIPLTLDDTLGVLLFIWSSTLGRAIIHLHLLSPLLNRAWQLSALDSSVQDPILRMAAQVRLKQLVFQASHRVN
jgi:hypothetical protein